VAKCRDHYNSLKTVFQKSDKENRKKTGIDDEAWTEYEQLLSEVIDLEEAEKKENKELKDKEELEKKVKEEKGAAIREAATKKLSQGKKGSRNTAAQAIAEAAQSLNMVDQRPDKHYEVEMKKLEVERLRLELEERKHQALLDSEERERKAARDERLERTRIENEERAERTKRQEKHDQFLLDLMTKLVADGRRPST